MPGIRYPRVQEEELSSETELVHRREDSIYNYPWVRHVNGLSSARDALAYIKPTGRDGSKRIVHLLGTDFTPDSPYLRFGDCPLEAILPMTFEPKRRPVPAYPVHQILSNWWALGVRLEVEDERRIRFQRAPENEAEQAIWTMVKGTLAAFDEALFEACRVWITSFWTAPMKYRHRWIAQQARRVLLTDLV